MAKYSKLDLGQIEAIVNKLGGMKGMNDFLSGKTKVVPADASVKVPKKPSALVRGGSFSAVSLTEKHNPQELYQTREGLFVWSDFTDWIISVTRPTEVGKNFKKASYWTLKQSVTGEMLKKEHSKDIWTSTDLCVWLSVKLETQAGGQSGDLLNNGYANLFLVQGTNNVVFVVGVRWGSGTRGWDVDAWTLDRKWIAGDRFFSKPTD